jgi:hypothetical protein
MKWPRPLLRNASAIRSRIEINILRGLLLGLVYGWIEETHVSQTSTVGYRIAYLLLLALPFISRDWKLWLGDGVTAMLTQDASFWVFAQTWPWSWAWYYPVLDRVPLLYPIALFTMIVVYWKAARPTANHPALNNEPSHGRMGSASS